MDWYRSSAPSSERTASVRSSPTLWCVFWRGRNVQGVYLRFVRFFMSDFKLILTGDLDKLEETKNKYVRAFGETEDAPSLS